MRTQTNITTGDYVQFNWAGGPHTVTQMGLDGAPCGVLPDGVNSGKQNATAQLDLRFNTAGRRWFGCTVHAKNGTGTHCDAGMRLTIDVTDDGSWTPSSTIEDSTATDVATWTTDYSGQTDYPTAAAETVDPSYPAATAYPSPMASSYPSATTPYSAAYPSASSTTTTTNSSTGTGSVTDPFIVTVGATPFTYSPKNLIIAPGQWVRWNFATGPHTVTQVATNGTCDALSGGSPSTGNMTAGMTSLQQFNQTGFVWYVCKVAMHCQKGMQGSIKVVSASASSSGGAANPAATGDSVATSRATEGTVAGLRGVGVLMAAGLAASFLIL
ncbi:hypothetical protein HKX48_000861 [Thoreauomyces humboldtii]|nr:hypothetical protein HKX48_000861 [Thoreauomyces humboldtii]